MTTDSQLILKQLLVALFVLCSTVMFGQCEVDAGSNLTICAGESVQLGGAPTVVQSGANPTVTWNNGAADIANPTVSPATTTTYTVTLTSDGDCQTTDQITVIVNPLPIADFDFNPDGACSSSPVQFTNTSSGTGLEYSWNFGNPGSGDANTSTANNPSHQFVAPGNGNASFNVTLTATDANGCVSSLTQNIQVIQSPDPLLTDADIFQPFVMCGNSGQNTFDITLNNSSTTQGTNVNYTLDWGDGTAVFDGTDMTSLSHTYEGTGFFDIEFTVEGANGCVITETYEVFAGSNPSVGLASPGSTINLCAPNTLEFPITNWQNNSDGTIYTVTFSDGSAPETFIHPPPESISHVFNTSSCGNTSIGGFQNSFHVRIIAENPCGFSAATIEPIQTSSAPTADLTVSPGPEGCAGAPFTFTNSSTNANFNNNGNCVSLMTAEWSIEPATGWAVTGGSLADPNSFSAIFDPGEYTITMVGANPCGSDEVSVDICVTTPPEALYTADPLEGCAPLLVPTNNLSSSLNNCDNETYLWQVTPAQGWAYATGNANAINPSFNFFEAGNYTIQLTVTNVCGQSIHTENVVVYEPPTVELNDIPSGCEGITFTPSAVYDNGGTPITNYAWNFPGGAPNSSNQASPGAVSYTNTGNYTVTIAVTNICGTTSDSQSFLIESAPVISVVPQNPEICAGESVDLSASGAVSYVWSPGGGLNTSNGSQVTASPAGSSTYTVTGTSAAGCTGSTDVSVDVNPNPTLTPGGPYEICAEECIDLEVTPSGGTPPYVNYNWSPATGLSSSNSSETNACLNSSQTYSVTVTDANGCTASTSVPVVVNPLPVVNAGPDVTLCDQPVGEQLAGFSPIGGVWSGPNVTAGGLFTPSGVGSFDLTYTFIDANGCENSDDLTVDVIAPVTVDAGPDLTFCSNIGNQQIIAPTPNGTWAGDNISADGVFSPLDPGTYTLTYSVGGGSCLTSDQIEVEVYPLPEPIAGDDEVICEGDEVLLNASVSGGTLPYQSVAWLPSADLSDLTILDPTASPSSNATFTLAVTDANGCEAEDDVFVEVLTAPVVNAGSDLTLCNQPIPEQLVGFSPLGGTWTGDGVTADGVFTPTGDGVFELTYSYTNAAGCGSEASIEVTVVDPENASAGDDFGICLGTTSLDLNIAGTWNGDFVSQDGTFTPSEVGTFVLTLTIGTGTCETSDQVSATVYPLPTVDVGADLTICEGGSTDLNAVAASANGDISTYEWTGTNLSSNDIADPVANPMTLTNYSVVVTDELGCQASDALTVEVSPLPEVNAGADLTICDQPINEVLEGFSPAFDAPNGTGAWTGTGIIDDSGVFQSPGEGSYTLTYTFTDNGGCLDTDQIIVTVVPPVVADAGADQSICLNNGLYELQGFTPLNNVTWSGDGIVDESGTFDPSESGAGDFELTIEFGSGTCYTVDQMTLTVIPLPELTVTEDPVFCGNDGVSSLGDFSPFGGWWEGTGIVDDANGTFDPSLGNGSYDVFYWYTDPMTGCSDTLDVTVSVSPVPEASFTLEDQGCTNANADLSNESQGGTNYSWDFGNGVTSEEFNPEYTYPDEGNYTVELTVSNDFGCVDVTSNDHEIVHPPEAGLSVSSADGCAPLEVSFENSSIGQYLSYEWDLDTSTSDEEVPDPVTYEQEDDDVVYTVTLTATNYCGSSTESTTVTVFPQPIASFGTDYDAFCSPWPTQFNNTSVGNPEIFEWDFGDGTTSDLEQPIQNVYFTGEEPTDYTITLTTTNDCGTDSYSYTITVLPNTVTAFFNTDVTSGCQPLTVDFTDFSTGGTVVSYDFGDGNVSNLESPTHTFTSSGVFEIAQFVNNGCSFDTTYAQIEVFSAPDPAFTAEELGVCAGDPVQFTNLTQDVNNVSWDFGDGNSSDVTNPVHTYESGGTYTVTIEVSSDGFECPGTLSQNYTVFNVPEAGFSIPDQVGCSPFEVTFTNTTVGGNFYEWDFGNGEGGNTANVTQTFVNDTGDPVLYTVTMTASNMQLCSSEFEMDVIVSPSPVADFDLSQSESCTFPVTLQLLNNSSFANGYQWDFGELGISSAVNPTVQVDAVGNYPLTLTASNSYGCSDSMTEVFSINPLPTVDFTSDVIGGCVPLTVNFTNTSTGGLSYQWFFGAAGTSTEENPTVTYNSPGFYDVALVVETDNGCTDTLIVDHQVIVHSLPNAAFTHDPEERTTIFSPLVNFTDQSQGAVYYYWNFGDGSSSQEADPTHIYEVPGTFNITLTVETGFGCMDQATSSIVILDQFNIYVPNAFTPDGDNVNDVFKPYVVGRGLLDSYQLSIYDRWGMEVFRTNDVDEPWLGDFRGGDYYVQNDGYIWQIKYKLKGADTGEVMTGHVLILR